MKRYSPTQACHHHFGVLTIFLGLSVATSAFAQSADPNKPAEVVITSQVLRPAEKVPPLGANAWGRCGAVEWAANNFIHNPGNEPIYWRNLHRATEVGPNWFEIDGAGTSWYNLWANGFLSGADVRIYRIVDKDGQPLPLNKEGKNLDLATADHVVLVGKTQVLPAGSKDFPDGGWVANKYVEVHPNAAIRHGNLAATDASGVENGRTYWYTVVALGPGDVESDIANEVSAVPQAGTDQAPRILIASSGDPAPALKPGANFQFAPKLFAGAAPCQWQVVDDAGKPGTLPDGLKLDPATGEITGKPAAEVKNLKLILKVTDAKGRTDQRSYVLNPNAPEAAAKDKDKNKPQPPKNVKAVAGDGSVTLTWEPSPSPNVVGYRLKRSTVPAVKQEARVYLAEGAPPLKKLDYIVLSKKFDPFDMKYVNPRVRGIGNPMNSPNWYWRSESKDLSFSLVPHPQPVPADMVDPGETCLQVKAAPGEQNINQIVFIGTQNGGESVWYGQLEPGKKYRLEVWLRQDGLAKDGAVTFSYGKGYPDIHQTFQVGKDWKKYTYDFVGPDRPDKIMHFGHQFAFTGPGTLWMDNARIFRMDRPEDAEKPYVPNATVLEELLKSQPASGPKGAHRIWFLARDAIMSSILSWHANSNVHPDWSTSVSSTMDMTLPMGLMFDLETGKDPQTRMIPWLVLQHVLHTEQDWLNLIEYLAAPYDPKVDSPEKKPWAYKRFQQRGVGTPWTDEFPALMIEFGNETWHNGVFEDWLGFSTRNSVWQGGPEYGLFTRYLCETMKKSPYWQAQNLDKKIRFNLGAGYPINIDKDGKITGYGEEAMQKNPLASSLGHANYVGPKWETGDKSTGVFNDHGVQEVLLGFLTGPEPSQIKMGQARDLIAKAGHDYDIVAYEGGPSGYDLPGPGREAAAQREANEKFGKSLAMGVAALDAWMRSYIYGWTYQNFLGYGQGSHWNSHTPLWDGFRPCPGWQALALRNRYASGDLMKIEEKSMPTIARKKDQLPLIGVYALRDGTKWSVFVLSRKLDGKHEDFDYADGSTPVTLRLPFAKAGKITLHKLTGDPRQSNRAKMNIELLSQDVPLDALEQGTLQVNEKSGGLKGGMPPGSIYLYVFENTAP